MLTSEATGANFSGFNLTRPGFQPPAFRTLSERSIMYPLLATEAATQVEKSDIINLQCLHTNYQNKLRLIGFNI